MRKEYLHLKPETRGHDHHLNTLCGLEDHGTLNYTSVKNNEDLEQVRKDADAGPYPLCKDCQTAFAALKALNERPTQLPPGTVIMTDKARSTELARSMAQERFGAIGGTTPDGRFYLSGIGYVRVHWLEKNKIVSAESMSTLVLPAPFEIKTT